MTYMKPVILMVLSQLASGSVNIFYKIAVADGMKVQIMVFYRLVFATAFMVPLAFIMERKRRPTFSWTILLQGVINGLLGAALGSNLYAESLNFTTATISSAMSNLTPAVTLIFAVIMGMERLDIHRVAGKAKLVGTVLGIGGALVLSLYKGMKINLWSINIHCLHSANATATTAAQNHSNLLGSILAFLSCASYAAWLVFQGKMRQRYPMYSSTALMCFCGAIQAGIYAFIRERHPSAWKLGWNIRLFTPAYAGILSSGLGVTIIAWCTKLKGPLYVSSFYPLALIFVAIVGTIVLHEELHVGSIIGSILIVIGLYVVIWGKAKEKRAEETEVLKSNNNGIIEIISFAGVNQATAAIVPEFKTDDQIVATTAAALQEA
ncbi:WAT1-related protein At1g68170-like [Lycium ferocissimum]|uniref:WAT1-related protein At1g68170-like n=1 Tax=Lycium ferocissimum TaxID=112874 RepID=UPI0028159E63|nr:WAT1-related protein At1g68170-like [Lycium ferocissimum]